MSPTLDIHERKCGPPCAIPLAPTHAADEPAVLSIAVREGNRRFSTGVQAFATVPAFVCFLVAAPPGDGKISVAALEIPPDLEYTILTYHLQNEERTDENHGY